MLGTIVNALAIIVGGYIGLVLKKGIKESWTNSITKAVGISTIIIGINGIITNMISVDNGKLSSSGELLLVMSLVIGTLIGEVLRLDDRFTNLSKGIESKMKGENFAVGFMNMSMLACVGAMAIMGSINEGVSGDSSLLLIKAVLDGVTAVVFASTLGMGVIFASIPVFLYQGAITLSATYLSGILQGALLNQVCFVGFAIIICIGLNFMIKEKIKTLNLIPSILIPVVWYFISSLI